MTTELFRENAYLKSCTATIVAVREGVVVLDQTVFYPEGGGQPGDNGALHDGDNGRWTVVDTRKGADGTILHVLADNDSPPRVGAEVEAVLDWQRRYRHMRTHTCLHLLCSLIPFPVTGGSISTEKGRLDFDMTEGVDKAAVENDLCALIEADHAVEFRWISDEEMKSNMDLVRTMSVAPPMGDGRVRLIEIDDTDLQPCGGTHVARTGEIGAVRLGKVEKKGKHNRRVNLHLE